MIWLVKGYDTHEGEYYSIAGEYRSEDEARAAALKKFKEIEETQPIDSSGGQSEMGIQDRLFIVRPDGSQYRYLPLPA